MCGTRGRDWMDVLIASRARPKSPLGPCHHLGHLLTVQWLAYDSLASTKAVKISVRSPEVARLGLYIRKDNSINAGHLLHDSIYHILSVVRIHVNYGYTTVDAMRQLLVQRGDSRKCQSILCLN